jgi:hypothetical protein
MKTIYQFFFLLFVTACLTSCVTGNDDNAVLRDHNEQLARTPRVLDLTVDGVPPSRDQQSLWKDFEVSPGQAIMISATLNAGNGASSATFDFSRSYYSTAYDEDEAKAVEPMTDQVINMGSGTMDFNFTYTVPTLDDDGDPFLSGDHINLTWWSSNDLGGQGFNDFNLIFK